MVDKVVLGDSPADSKVAEHDAKMAEKFDNQNGQPAKPQRPDYIPEKFWDADKGVVKQDELAKSYVELEKLHAKKSEKKDEAPKAKPAEDDATKAAQDAAKAKGVDITKYASEFSQSGELSDASYAELEAAGISRAYVDNYIAGQVAIRTSLDNAALAVAGGEKSYDAMTSWAKANMTAEEIAAYNTAVASSNEATVTSAVRGLAERYQGAVGKDPSLLEGGHTPSEGNYANWFQVTEAMKDPRYARDDAYRASVAKKIANSPNLK